MSAPGGRGSALILADAKVSKKSENKEFCGIKFVNNLNNHQYTYSNFILLLFLAFLQVLSPLEVVK